MDPMRSDVRSELAALAAQLIADSGLDYQSAKRKAARQVFGDGHISAAMLPDNEAIDQSLLEHLQLFDRDHDLRVARYREAALFWMERLDDFNPYLAGSVWKGIVAAHAPIHLQVFTDDAKELEIRLLERRHQFRRGRDRPLRRAQRRAGADLLLAAGPADPGVGLSLRRPARRAEATQKSGNGRGRAERGNLAAVRELLEAVRDNAADSLQPKT